MSWTENIKAKNAYKTRRQLGTYYQKVMNKEKEKDCKFL